jgi:hypothetical protein
MKNGPRRRDGRRRGLGKAKNSRAAMRAYSTRTREGLKISGLHIAAQDRDGDYSRRRGSRFAA